MKTTRLGVLAAAFMAVLAARAAAQTSDEIYDESRIATFRFTMSAADWQTLCERDTGIWYRADMTWQPPGGTLETVPGVGMRRSGGGTPNPNVVWYTPKPGVRISFNEFEFANPAGPGTPGRKWHDVNRIKLDSMIGNTDLSMMRDRLAYGILKAAGATAPRACHARVYVNGDFKGLWTVEEPVRKDFTRQRWGEDGGNLYEMEYGGTNAYDWRGNDPSSYVQSPFQEHNNSPGGNYADLVELINIVNNGGNQIRSQLNAYIHMDRFLSYLAATTVYGDNDDIVHWGGGSNNHYWYHRASSNLMELIKWDPGASMGMYEPDFGIPKGQSPLGYRYGSQEITAWVVNDATAWDTYKTKIRNLLDGYVAGIHNRIDSIYAQIRDHAYADPYKGQRPDDPNGFTNAEFDAYVDWIKDWWSRRVAYLRAQVGGAPPPPTPTDAAQFVSQDVPSAMVAGQLYSVTVTMRNSGTTTWTSGGGYRLNSRGPYDNTTWGLSRVPLGAGESVAPGQQKAFSFTMTAPATAGTYLSRWSVANDALGGFDATTPDVTVTVSGAPPPPPPPPPTPTDRAEFISQNIPSTMDAGQNYTVTVTMRNSGTTTWTAAGGYRLNSRGPYDNTTWTTNRVPLAAGDSIAPGQSKPFTFIMTAPTTPGTYLSRWSMAVGTTPFDVTTPDVNVDVTAPPPPPPPPAGIDDAEFVSQNIPPTMAGGQTYTVTVTMRNSGTTTWTGAAGYRLNSRGPYDNTTWITNRVPLAAGDSIAPGQSKIFTFTMTAPATPGMYLSRWSMVQDGVDVFGETTADVNVDVVASAPAAPPTPTSSRAGENDNGDGWINDKCGGSIVGGTSRASALGWPALGLLVFLIAGAASRKSPPGE